MKSLLAALFMLVFLLNPFLGQSQNENQALLAKFKPLEKEVVSLLDSFNAAGVSIAIVKDGETIYTKGFGFRDVSKKLPVDENTIFAIGSCSKAFTASLLGILQGDSLLSLNDRPSQYIPELQFYNSTMDDAIQIKTLLSHSTGISNHSSESSIIFFESNNINDLIPRLKHIEPVANVGESFLYNNYMYTLAAIISERVTGKSWTKTMTERIFDPLNMTHTFTGTADAKKSSDFSYGYSVKNNAITKVLPQEIPTVAAAGEIHSSAKDMATWLNVWMNEGKYQGQQILPVEYLNAAIRPQQIMRGGPAERLSDTPLFINYGYGWGNLDFKGYYRVDHSGAVSGYTSNTVFFPTEKVGIVVLSNQSNSNISNTITNLYIDELLGLTNTEPRVPIIRYTTVDEIESAPSETLLKEDSKPSFSLEDLIGEYEHPGFGQFTVSYRNGLLYANFPFTTLRLSHDSNNSFASHFTEELPTILTGGSWIYFEFESDEKQSVSGVRVNMSADGVLFERNVKQE